MAEQETTTRVYSYGAVPLGPVPEELVVAIQKANDLWNRLVEIHNENSNEREQALRDVEPDYERLSVRLENLDKEIEKAFRDKRDARMHARTRSSDDPLISKANEVITELKSEQRELWGEIKPVRKIAATLIDQKLLNDQFNERVKQAQQKESTQALREEYTEGLEGSTANEVYRNFREARSKVFNTPRSRLRFHRFDGTGYTHYRFRDNRTRADGTKSAQDGVSFDFLKSRGADDDRPFTLSESEARGGKPRLKLKAKVAGGHAKASKIYAEFDVVLHRPIPKGAQINNAKLMRRRIGDRFKYTVNFSVRVPAAAKSKAPKHAIGVDIGFRRLLNGTIRGATIGSTDKNFGFQTVELSKRYVERIDHIEALQSDLDDSASELGKRLKPLIIAGSVLPEEHARHKMLQSVANLPSNRTMSFETAYKLAAWFKNEPDTLPAKVQIELMDWWDRNAKRYREMHHLRKKTLGWRKEEYRILAAKLVSYGLPIGIEAIDLSEFAEVKDKDNELSDKARSQRFLVANSELLGAIKNAAQREGVQVPTINPKNTSKTCSACGKVNKELKAELKWICPSCGVAHDRDENASVNIARAALKKASKA
jgi:transposase